MMYTIKPTSRFKKDLKAIKKSGYNIGLLVDTIKILASGQELPPENKDHPLTGNWSGYRECHVKPDWLLIYRIDDDILVLTLARSGSHSKLLDI